MNTSIINSDFIKSIDRLRKMLPALSFGLLIGTYVISALIMGIFHAQSAKTIGFTIAAFLVPLAIQLGRGTLVFFFQLNPARIQHRFSMGIIAATALLLLSLIEAYLVLASYDLAWIISVSTLMGIGWILEIMIMKEMVFATQMTLFQNKEQWHELKAFYTARTELQQFMESIKKGEPPALLPEPEVNAEDDKALNLLKELKHHLEGNVECPSMNGQII